jgi:hypothetical protein
MATKIIQNVEQQRKLTKLFKDLADIYTLFPVATHSQPVQSQVARQSILALYLNLTTRFALEQIPLDPILQQIITKIHTTIREIHRTFLTRRKTSSFAITH